MREEIKVATAAAIGIAFEFYDFLIFGFISSTISALFFPSENPIASLLSTFAAFATGFIGRPIGAIVFGHLGDRIGRKYSLIITITMMGVSSVLIGLLPTYYQIGTLASILIVILRFLQGFSLGGEFGGGIVLAAEFAKSNERAYIVGLANSAQGIGPLIATGLILLFSVLLSPSDFNSYGWRILYILGGLIAVIGVYIRLKISESPIFYKLRERNQIARVPLSDAFRSNWKEILIGIGFIVGGTTMTYTTGVFASSYLQTVIKLPTYLASSALLIGYVTLSVLSPLWGRLSDKVGRKPLMIAEAVGLLLFVYPYFLLLSTGNFLIIVLAQVVAQTIFSMANGAYPAALSEMFPTSVRYTALSFVYHVGVAAFGGTTPYINTYLIYVTKNNLAPVYWGVFGMLVTLVAYLIYKETKGTEFES
ncbi:MAG: MFS transporter [Sulfolobaceae archaeon]